MADDGTDAEVEDTENPTEGRGTTRRDAIKSAGLVGTGVVVGYGAATVGSDEVACAETVPRAVREMDDTEFWLADDDELQRRPLYTLSLPGTHHASFHEMTENWTSADFLTRGHVERWTKPQSRDVRTQLRDGIRYLDVRPFYDPDSEDGRFWGHHEVARGASLDDVFGDLDDFLNDADAAADGNELVVVKLSHIRNFDAGARDSHGTARPGPDAADSTVDGTENRQDSCKNASITKLLPRSSL